MAETQQAAEVRLSATRSKSRRTVLIIASYATFALGAIMTLVPFAKSFRPSRRAIAVGGPVDVDISNMQPGQLRVVKWRGRPVWVLRRNQTMLASLSLVTDLLADPNSKLSDQPGYATNPQRAEKAEWLVMIGVCTHLGCSPLFKPQRGAADMGQGWQGGFFCPCHGTRFDLAGRVFKNMPAPTNMPIPDYSFISDKVIRIGEAPGGAA